MLALVSLISIIIIKFIWNDTPERIPLGSEIGEVLFDLSVGYLAAFFFFIIQIWIPEYKEQKIVRLRIATPLSRLLDRMKTPIDKTLKTYGNPNIQFDNIPKTEFIEMIEKIDLSQDEGFVANRLVTGSISIMNFGGSLAKQIYDAEEYIKEIKEMPFKLDFDLIDLLVRIENCSYHERVKSVDRALGFKVQRLPDGTNQVVGGDLIADPIYDYYLMFFELKEYMKKNQIQITVSTV